MIYCVQRLFTFRRCNVYGTRKGCRNVVAPLAGARQETMDILFRVILIAVTLLIALVIGLFLRRMLVRRLKQTVLDKWLVQTLGAIVIAVLLILAIPVSFTIADMGLISSAWQAIAAQFSLKEITGFTGSIVETLLIIALGLGFARTLMTLTIRRLGTNHIDINTRTLLGRVLYILTLTLIAFWILSIWQISIGVPVAALGILTVAFTVAIQDILKDLVAGFYILMERPFHIGDEINTASYVGKVEDIQIRATKLRLVSGEQVTIPNAMVFGGVVVNNTYYGERRATITATMPQEEYKRKETPELMLKTLQEIDTVMVKPEPAVFISGYTGKQMTL